MLFCKTINSCVDQAHLYCDFLRCNLWKDSLWILFSSVTYIYLALQYVLSLNYTIYVNKNLTDFTNQLNYTRKNILDSFSFLFRASFTFYMVEFVHEIIQCLVNANIKLKLQIWISRYPCSNVVRRNKTSLSTINWSPYWMKDDAITKKL